jgi:hypothetical protein
MNRLFLIPLLLLLLTGCQTTMQLSPASSQRDFARASKGCHGGDNLVTLRSSPGALKAYSVQFRADSILWMSADSTWHGAPLWNVSRVENTDHERGVKEGARIGFAVGLMTGGLITAMSTPSASYHGNSAPYIMLALSALVVGPLAGGAEGGDKGSHLTVVVDSTGKAPQHAPLQASLNEKR